MQKQLIIVSGKDGQLGYELMQLQEQYNQLFNFLFVGRKELDLVDENAIINFIELHKPNYFINAAAYTAVDKAETDVDAAYNINAKAPLIIAKTCQKINCQLIHISTDYVFDGDKNAPYLPTDLTNPLNIYGKSKAAGEKLVIENNPAAIIIRTSWVYSSHGKNFVKTMLKLMSEREEISVVDDQIGNPTNAADLAAAIMQIVIAKSTNPQSINKQLYHYTNTGNISWFQFAQAIQEIAKLKCVVKPIPSTAYPTPAKRANYGVLDTSDIAKDFGVEVKDWRVSLEKEINLLVS